jgi:hypothetical protein
LTKLYDKDIALLQKLKDDFPYYAEKNLKIRLKTADETGAKIAPFLLNRAQKYIHEKLQAQKAEKGRVRALILKGRQQGSSTYVGGRFYHNTTYNKGRKTFILTHLDDATDNLFKLVKRYHDNCHPRLKPSTSFSNRKELVFNNLDSAYSVGTAGSGQTGRSDTIDYLHGSEVAFWRNAKEIKTGVMQAANMAEEIILESTANGFDPMFKPMWDEAEKGESEYMAIFVPWFWQEEYTLPVDDFEPTKEESLLLEMYAPEGMTLAHIAWRRNKLKSDLGNDETLFKQEYPCCSAEAFQVTGVDSFIKPEPVLAARKRVAAHMRGAHILGIDPARGGDRTAFMHRQGCCMWFKESEIFKSPDTSVIVGRVCELFKDTSKPLDWAFIDVGGLGGPIYDQLQKTAWRDRIIQVNFGSTKTVHNKERYNNKKAEMLGDFKDWLEDDTNQASITDSDVFQKDICAPGYTYDNQQRYVIESKKNLKARGIDSTDLLDAGGLTFAEPVGPYNDTFIDDFDDVNVLL